MAVQNMKQWGTFCLKSEYIIQICNTAYGIRDLLKQNESQKHAHIKRRKSHVKNVHSIADSHKHNVSLLQCTAPIYAVWPSMTQNTTVGFLRDYKCD